MQSKKESEIFLSHINDLKAKSENDSLVTFSNFLDLKQQSDVSTLLKNKSETKLFFFGGFDGSERQIAFFAPSFFEIDSIENVFENFFENPISLLKIKKDKFSSVSHRDYLGALMGLGIKRELIGDIVPSETECFAFCLKSIVPYVKENLTSVGRATVFVEDVDINSFKREAEILSAVDIIVPSLRLDNVVSEAFCVSRKDAVAFIKNGLVFVDSVAIQKPDKQIVENSKIVLRGKGKVAFKNIKGKSKKGNLILSILKYN